MVACPVLVRTSFSLSGLSGIAGRLDSTLHAVSPLVSTNEFLSDMNNSSESQARACLSTNHFSVLK